MLVQTAVLCNCILPLLPFEGPPGNCSLIHWNIFLILTIDHFFPHLLKLNSLFHFTVRDEFEYTGLDFRFLKHLFTASRSILFMVLIPSSA